ncbi:MAG: universal stress protein [Acidaminococcaceae bacterium]|jgi:nucleotide-binding universal stress UspA family protein|nr:universal stress protein [Acidaminococcaceae bacterium]
MIKKILVPIDGSEVALRALEFALEIGKKLAAEIIVLNVDIPYDLNRIVPAKGKDADGKEVKPIELGTKPLEDAEKAAKKFGYEKIIFKQLVDVDPSERICIEAKRANVDLVVMGNRGMGTLAGFFLGSVSTKVSQNVHCPVTIMK